VVTSPSPSPSSGWRVALAGLGINLALGVLYTWSLFKGAIEKDFGWKGDQLNDPYALCCLVFAFAMILAGRVQDTFGPRITATVGGVLVAAGMLLISTTSNYTLWVIGFGVLVGTGIGFGYACATPAALKWFPGEKTGMVAGIVVAGFGLAPVYLAPLSETLLKDFGLLKSMFILGILFAVIVIGLSQFLRNPTSLPSSTASSATGSPASSPRTTHADLSPVEIISKGSFWLLWMLYFIGAGAGLMVIGSISGMAKKSMGSSAFVAVAVLAIGNALGRVVAGSLSDRIGRRRTLLVVFLFQAALMFLAMAFAGGASSAFMLVTVAALIGANYGANLALFPSIAKDLYGLRNFGMNYGLLFTAWGVGGFVLSRVSQMLKASSGNFGSSFLVAGILLVVGALLTQGIRNGEK
jgi:OFA family oxalate/formate antiporter-like MFS transporter